MNDDARTTFRATDIDEVAARMTEGHVASDLRSRVLDRLAPTRRTPWTPIALRALAAAAMLAVVAMMWSRWNAAPLRPSGQTVKSVAANSAPRVETPSSTATMTGTSNATVARRRRVRAETAAVPGLPVLVAPATLTIEGIQPATLAIPQLRVASLITEPLRISAVDGGGVNR